MAISRIFFFSFLCSGSIIMILICISSNSKKSFLFFSIDKAVIYIYIYIYTCSQKTSVFKPLRSRILLDFFAMSSSSLTRLAVSAVAGVAVGFGLGAWYALRLGRRKVGEETNKQSSVLFPDLCLCVVLLFCHSCLFCLFVLSNIWTNYSHRALNVPSLEDGCLDLQLANIKRFSGKLAQLCSFSQIHNRPKKGNASRANVWVFSRVYRIQSGDCLPPAVDECLPVNHAKNNMDLKKYSHMRNMLYSAISVVWRWNLNFQ